MWDELQGRVQGTIDELVASGREQGVQVSAYLDGVQIIDACAGVADPVTGREVSSGTPFPCFSTAKGFAATAVHVLAEQGKLDYDLRIADVWPEFAQHGKGGATLRHALTHATGVPHLPADITPEDFTDWDRMCQIIAASEPVWEPGTACGYHAWTFGWIVGETVRRATGRTLSQVLATDVAGRLGSPGEMFFGVPEADLDRLAVLADRNLAAMTEQLASMMPNFDRVAPPAVRPGVELCSRPDILRADIPAVGVMTARAAARMFAALIGEVDGVRLISPDRLREATTQATKGPDWIFGVEMPMGLGFDLTDGSGFGSSGSGGSLAYAYPAEGLTVAAAKNLLGFGDGDPMEELAAMIRAEVKVVTRG